jgi:uncharacterized membrane protein YebE (DUF533 family)
MDLSRLAEALLGGAATPPRRRRRRAAPSLLGSSRSREAQAVRGLATLAGIAIEALGRSRSAPPPPAPAPARRAPDLPPPRVETTPKPSPWGVRQPAPPTEPEPEAPAAEEAEALLLIRAMIAAAVADGVTDAAERAAIAAQLDAAGLDVRERDFVLADFDRPMTPEALAREASDPMLAAQLYAAAVAAAGEISAGERAFLDRFAKALRLDKAAAAAIEQRLGAA